MHTAVCADIFCGDGALRVPTSKLHLSMAAETALFHTKLLSTSNALNVQAYNTSNSQLTLNPAQDYFQQLPTASIKLNGRRWESV